MNEAIPGTAVNNAIRQQRFIHLGQLFRVHFQTNAQTLTLAVATGRLDVVELVLRNNAKPDLATFDTALATNNQAIIQLISTLPTLPKPKQLELDDDDEDKVCSSSQLSRTSVNISDPDTSNNHTAAEAAAVADTHDDRTTAILNDEESLDESTHRLTIR